MEPVTDLPVMMPAAAEIFLAVMGMALLMLGVFRGEGSLRLLSWATVASFGVAAVLVIVTGGQSEAFYGAFITEPFAQFAKVLILLGSALAVIMSLDYLDRERAGRFEYPISFCSPRSAC